MAALKAAKRQLRALIYKKLSLIPEASGVEQCEELKM